MIQRALRNVNFHKTGNILMIHERGRNLKKSFSLRDFDNLFEATATKASEKSTLCKVKFSQRVSFTDQHVKWLYSRRNVTLT